MKISIQNAVAFTRHIKALENMSGTDDPTGLYLKLNRLEKRAKRIGTLYHNGGLPQSEYTLLIKGVQKAVSKLLPGVPVLVCQGDIRGYQLKTSGFGLERDFGGDEILAPDFQ